MKIKAKQKRELFIKNLQCCAFANKCNQVFYKKKTFCKNYSRLISEVVGVVAAK